MSESIPVEMLRRFAGQAKKLYFAASESDIEECLRRAWEEGYGHKVEHGPGTQEEIYRLSKQVDELLLTAERRRSEK